MHLIITGGTIDKKYNELTGLVDFAPTSHIEEMLTQARIDLTTLTITPLLLKDSLELTPKDRESIIQTIQSSQSDQILITHGTDTMVESAKYIASFGFNKAIVLLGAMIPYRIKNSDALFNLGFALGAMQNLDYGVYVAMNGQLFKDNQVSKDYNLGVFKSNAEYQ